MSKRIFLVLFMVLNLIVSPFISFSAQALSPLSNALIKIDGNPTVYWLATDNRRYVFPNPRTFYSWFSEADLARVLTLSPQELGRITIGGNVTYRPGVRLVKVTTDPRVYAVSRYGVLRWVTSESVAAQLYGANWARMVDDVPDEFFTNYRVGDPITAAGQFSPDFEWGQARSPSDNIPPSSYIWPTPPTYPPAQGSLRGQAVLTVSNATPVVNEEVIFTADAYNVSPVQNVTLSIFRADTGELYRTCGVVQCRYTMGVYTQAHVGQSYRYYARLLNTVTGERIDSATITITPRNAANVVSVPATSHAVTFDRSSVRPGESFTVFATLQPMTNAPPYYTIRIYDQWNVLRHTCERVRTCILQQTLSQTSDTSRTYYASAVADNGHSIGSGNATIQVIQPNQGVRLGNSQLMLGLSGQNSVAAAPYPTYLNGSELRISADVTPAHTDPTGLTIKFYDLQNNLLFTCSNYNSCSTTRTLANGTNQDATVGFKARVEDRYGSWYETPISYVIIRPSQSQDFSNSVYNRTFELSPSNTSVQHGDTLTLTARLSPQTGSANGFIITITNPLGTVLRTCNDAFTCNVDQPIFNTGPQDGSIVYSARVTSLDGHWNAANTPTITIRGNQSPAISGRIGLGISHSSISSSQPFNLNARVIDSNVSDQNVSIAWYQSSNDALITTCDGVNPCLVTTSYPIINNQSRVLSFYARAWDKTNTLNGNLVSDAISITITP